MSKLEQTARVFRRRRKQWISALDLVKVGGLLAWRTEISRCRTVLGMVVEWKSEKGRSYYRYVGRKAA